MGIRDKIRGWTREGVSFKLIAERINRLPTSEEEKSALWLWAWSFQSHRGRGYRESRQGVLAD